MGIVAGLVSSRLEALLPGSGEVLRATRVALAIGAALVALVLSARVLRIEEFTDASQRVLRRLRPVPR
jgi:hypothetical protein